MRPRLIAVDDRDELREIRDTYRQLQGGHGGSPWMTDRQAAARAFGLWLQGGHGGSPWMTDVLAERRRQIEAASMRPRLIAVDDPRSTAEVVMGAIASMRPRLIAVDDTFGWWPVSWRASGFNEATADRRGGPYGLVRDMLFPQELQGDHGGSPWMTAGASRHEASDRKLQGGHGGSPWMTRASTP